MDNQKTSGKRDFSLKSIQKVRLKKSSVIRVHDPKKAFSDPRQVSVALYECLKEGDTEAFKEILSAYLDTTNKESFSKHAGIPRRTLFRMLSPPGNPTLEHLAKLVKALNHKKAA